jgi:hypothetical protein
MTNLTYLFLCRFTDGTTLQQTQEDVSTIDSTRNAFYDVTQRLAEVETFTLIGQNGRHHSFSVNLCDGHFEVNGVAFHAQTDQLPGEAKFRLIYFHRHQHKVIQGQAMTGDSSSVEYHIG